MSRVLILGAQGQLGIELQKAFQGAGEVVALDRQWCDLARPETIRKAMAEVCPKIVLNAAAYTAVDRAESEPELAMRVNGEAPGILAEEARKIGALLVHYSTDYVFDGSRPSPWVEGDAVNPLNTYGRTKLAGEQKISEVGGRHLIFRTSWVYSPHGANFLRTMLRLGREREQLRVVNDQIGAPTTAAALARATRAVIDANVQEVSGIYHMTCAGETSWCGFAQEIFRRAAAPEGRHWPEVVGIPSTEYPTPAKRPKNSLMSNSKLNARFGVALPQWQDALAETLAGMNLG
ncbi:MAG: dTDP-4-dehydrorhamnose reductase [Silvibacterium sp.]|nr:dTDP-4-dehydrorhamnose reductase [Silvibacterium sp.]